MPPSENKLSELRAEISKIDTQIIQLLDSRAEIVKKIGSLKKQLNYPIIDHEREQKVYDSVSSMNLQHLTIPQVMSIYREIIASSRAIQLGRDRVAFLGPPGTFSDQAAKTYFPQASTEFFVVHKIPDVFRKVISNEVDYGVVPVENTIYGSVPITLDLLLESDLKVSGEIIIRIKHNLIATHPMPLSEIKTLLSKDQAIGQCRQFIEENLQQVEIIETKSTAQAVESLNQYEQAAAIGTESAVELYHRVILAKGIEDNQNNFTRFFVIGHQESLPTGNDKTSIIFSVKHEPGALLTALKSFSSRKINLTKLESRPSRLTPWEYFFYTDFEGHLKDENVKEALNELKNSTLYIKLLGSYKSH